MYDYNRYEDRSRFVTDESEIKIYGDCYVPILNEGGYEIGIFLRKGASEIDDIKKYIMSLLEHICELDNIVQKYNSIVYPQENDFPFELDCIQIDGPEDIRLGYDCYLFNTQFDVGFKWIGNRFILKSFGLINDIPEDWDK